MGVFKNEVGRPSNKIIKTRRLLLGSSILVLAGAFVLGSNYFINNNKPEDIKGSTLQLVQADTSGVYFAENNITVKDNSISINEKKYIYGDIYSSTAKKVGYDGVINTDDANYLEKNLSKIQSSNNLLIKKLSDVNHDGKINKTDVNLIKRMSNNQKTIYGDLDGDKKITYKDKKLLYKYLNGKVLLKRAQKKLADIDGNGIVNKNDYKLMLYKPAYEYCVSTEGKLSNAKKSCIWHKAGNISNLNEETYYIYRKDLSSDEIIEKGKYYIAPGVFDYEKPLKKYISEFDSSYFGITNNPGRGEFLLERYANRTFTFCNYVLNGRVKDAFYGYGVDDIFKFQIIDKSTNKVLFDSTTSKEFNLKAGVLYNLKLKGTIITENNNQIYESKTVKLRLVDDGTYIKNMILGKKSEVLFLKESYTKKSITLSKNVIYQEGALMQLRDSIDTIVIPKGFDFSNLQRGSLSISNLYLDGNQSIKIINKSNKSADWKTLISMDYNNSKNMEECTFITGTCNLKVNDNTKNIIVTNK